MGDGAIRPKGPPSTHNRGASLLQSSYRTQQDIARTTGGVAVYSSNDLVGSLEKVTKDEGSYYTLSYSPSNRNFDGQLRHIRVRLEEGDYRLSYRRAYYGLSTQDVDVPAGDTLSASMKHGAPESHQLVFMARHAHGFARSRHPRRNEEPRKSAEWKGRFWISEAHPPAALYDRLHNPGGAVAASDSSSTVSDAKRL